MSGRNYGKTVINMTSCGNEVFVICKTKAFRERQALQPLAGQMSLSVSGEISEISAKEA